ncbi:unnamed protein product [Diatraea saccharalis]|uniref:Uncharacterized protein n=1 Tax=Diatraea saccharalis TaxID=40085 RepID=A0A9N9WEM9_9NEOP|nr:unnamed protein product [Diatraea saccharalis]
MPHLYLLVEWTKTNNHIPQYDIVSVIPEKYRDVNLKVGNIILMLKRREQTPRLCCVLRVSYVKQKLLELKSLLEDQTNGFRNYLLEYPHSESEQPDSAIRYIDHRYLDNDTSQIRRLASTPSQNVSSNRFHQPVCNVKPKKDKNTQTDSEITAGDQPNHLLHTEGKILLKQIYRNFIGIFGEVAGIRDIIANYPDLNQALGYDTDVEESVQNDATVVNDSSTFQDVVNSEVSSPGNITDATTTSQTVSDEQTEVADNSHAITTSTTATSTTPDNGKQEMVDKNFK